MVDYGRLKTDLLALTLLAAAVFVGLSLASFDPADPPAQAVFPLRAQPVNLCGEIGARLAYELTTWFGYGAYLVLAALLVLDLRLFSRESIGDPVVRLIGAMLLLVATCVAAQLLLPPMPHGPLLGSGGNVGAWGSILLDKHFSKVGTLVLVVTTALAGLLLTGEIRLVGLCLRILALPITIWGRLAFGHKGLESLPSGPPDPGAATDNSEDVPEPLTAADAVPSIPVVTDDNHPKITHLPEPEEVDEEPEERLPIKVNPPAGMTLDRVALTKELDTAVDEPTPFQLPDHSFLADAQEFPYELLAQKAQGMAAKIEKTFQEFNLNVKVVEIDTGPVITQFELELEAGLRLAKVTSLADDLAIALRVPSVRVVAPIPGKNTVGVEVPNDVRVMVRLKELLESCRQDFEGKQIPLFLGKDVSGKPLVVDLCKMPHLLIAGRTGTGKSVCLNTLILSMLMSRSPQQVKMLMIDPKMVELSPYMRIPHLMHPVITDMKKAEAVLGWAVDKMEERYDLAGRWGPAIWTDTTSGSSARRKFCNGWASTQRTKKPSVFPITCRSS
ncbi:MAG: DNA translocase FtsK 4TM domain-containing protein [Planctomycetaceae bacterium]